MKAYDDKKDEMINFLWQLNVVDIATALSHVCQSVLRDPNISKAVLKLRAKAMKILGQFSKVQRAYTVGRPVYAMKALN